MQFGQAALMLFGWEGNRRPGRKLWHPAAGFMTKVRHLRADCQETEISSERNAC